MNTNVLYYGDSHELFGVTGKSWPTICKWVRRRDGFQCQICGDVEPLPYDGALFVHHIIHRAHDGTDDPDNLLTLCDLCHQGVLHGYHKWLGVLSSADVEKQVAKLELLRHREDYEWFARLLRDEFLSVQKDIWIEWGIEKRASRR